MKDDIELGALSRPEAAIALMRLHIFHGVWYRPDTRQISIRRSLMEDVEHLPWSECQKLLNLHGIIQFRKPPEKAKLLKNMSRSRGRSRRNPA